MKAAGLLLLGAMLAIGWTIGFWASQAQALPAFKKAFEQKYVQSGTPAVKAMAKAEGCNICHVKGQEKTTRNDYGKALGKFLGGEGETIKAMKAAKASGGDKAAKEVVDKAAKSLTDEGFDKVADEKGPSGNTFGEQIKAGKAPAAK